ncbi:MAG: 30S ribosomal protein S16 [Paludibacteraceae bacterium]
MAVKMRLQRHGRKGYAYYHIVIADSRAPRDGKFIERIGSYNPNTDPATVNLKFDRALYWLNVGAQPTDTTRNILSGEGVLMMKHLQGGVKKGAFDETEAEKRFNAWKTAKDNAVNKTKAEIDTAKQAKAKERAKAEADILKEKKAELAKKRAEAIESQVAEAAEEIKADASESTKPETTEETAAPEAPAAE